jgi:type II secretion system protein N
MDHDRSLMTGAYLRWPDEWKEALWWIAGGLGVFVLCFLMTFPYDALHSRVMAEVTRTTGMEVRVADWSVGVPLGLEWRNVTFSQPTGEPVQLALMQAKIGFFKAMTGGLSLDVMARVNEGPPNSGIVKGTLSASSYSMVGPVTVKGHLQQIDLSKVIRRYVTQGVLSGDFTQHVESGQAPVSALKGEGSWRAEVKDLHVDGIALGQGKTLALAFSKVSVGVTCRDLVCEVTELLGDGLDGSFTGEGKLTLQQPVQNSQLALTVTVVPGAGFTSKAGTLGLPPLPPGTPMTVKIQGTLAQARLAL